MSIRITFFAAILLAISVGSQAGYANKQSLQRAAPGQATSPTSSQPLQASALLAGKGNPAAPSVCSPIGFSNTGYPTGSNPASVRLGDFNGDGRADLVTANYGSSNVSVLLGNGNGTFQSATNYPSGGGADHLAVADIFGDRVDDLVVATSASNGLSYLQGVGDGTFFPPYNFTVGYVQNSVEVSDLNNDTYADLVSVNGGSVLIWLNDGEGGFGPITPIPVSGSPFSAAISDLNGDGRSDLVTANYGSSNVSVLLGNGNGTFQSPINFMAGNIPLSVAVGDFNGDGNPDLATANSGSDNVSVLLGNGDGLFQAAVNFGTGDAPNEVTTGDLNSDGKSDLATANSGSGNVSVLLGNGNGSFQAAVSFSAGDRTYAVVVSDLNGDSKPDMVAANLDSSNVSVLLNTCVSVGNTPTPTPLPTQTPGGPTATPQTCSILFADVPSANTFYPFVRCLACRGIIGGYACGGPGEPCNPQSDPYFRPGNPVTRGQLAKIVSNSAGFSDTPTGQSFQDVPPGSTFYLFSERLASRGVMAGYACGGPGEPCGGGNLPYFRPGAGATRGQLTKIVSNAAGFSDPAPATYTFTDVPPGSTFHPYVERLLLNRPGVTGGYACGGAGEPCDTQSRPYFRPSSPLTRGQTSKIVGNTFFPGCQTP